MTVHQTGFDGFPLTTILERFHSISFLISVSATIIVIVTINNIVDFPWIVKCGLKERKKSLNWKTLPVQGQGG